MNHSIVFYGHPIQRLLHQTNFEAEHSSAFYISYITTTSTAFQGRRGNPQLPCLLLLAFIYGIYLRVGTEFGLLSFHLVDSLR